MNKEDFLNQKANDMTISELAEAIKLKEKSVLRTGWVVGAKVKRKKDCGGNDYFFEGMTGIITNIRHADKDGDIFIDVRLPTGDISENNAKSNLELVTEKPKAIWTDITKECEFKLGDDSLGSHYLYVWYKGENIAHVISSEVSPRVLSIFWTLRDKYKVVNFDGKELEKPDNFKILKRGD